MHTPDSPCPLYPDFRTGGVLQGYKFQKDFWNKKIRKNFTFICILQYLNYQHFTDTH